MKKFIYPLMLLLILASCETVNKLTISCLQPATVNFPDQIKKIGIVNNIRSQFGKDAKGRYVMLSKDVLDSPLHTNGAKTAEALANGLADQQYFDEVVICDSALRSKDSLFREKPLDSLEVAQLAEGLDVDGILSLEDLNISVNKNIIPHLSENFVEGLIMSKMQPIVSFYVPRRNAPVFTIAPKDSIFWHEVGGTSGELETYILPNDTKVVTESCDYAGNIPIKYLVPCWAPQDRVYFSSQMSTPLKNAAAAVSSEDWKTAGSIWKQQYDKTSSDSKRMMMAFNMALFSEVNNQLDEGITWLKKAYSHLIAKTKTAEHEKFVGKTAYYYDLINEYKKILEGRKDKISQLNLQLGRFHNENK